MSSSSRSRRELTECESERGRCRSRSVMIYLLLDVHHTKRNYLELKPAQNGRQRLIYFGNLKSFIFKVISKRIRTVHNDVSAFTKFPIFQSSTSSDIPNNSLLRFACLLSFKGTSRHSQVLF